MRTQGGYVRYVPPPGRARRFRLTLELDAAKLVARSGDRIGLQLLYTGGGWDPVGEQTGWLEKVDLVGNQHRVLLTSRIELIAR